MAKIDILLTLRSECLVVAEYWNIAEVGYLWLLAFVLSSNESHYAGPVKKTLTILIRSY